MSYNNEQVLVSNAPQKIQYSNTSVLNPETLNNLCRLSELMSQSSVTIPEHLRGKPGDCLAICMQAFQWQMNPYAVAQKTYLVHGKLGYEAQLINAVITANAPTKNRLTFNHFGNWENILAKRKQSKNEKGALYFSSTWDLSDEVGVGVTVSATIKGENEPRQIHIFLNECFPRNSTMWAIDPRQQITYVAVKKWARRHCPDVILGVYTNDEIEDHEINTYKEEYVENNTLYVEQAQQAQQSLNTPSPSSSETKLFPYPDNQFKTHFPKWLKSIQAGSKTADEIIDMICTRFSLSDNQIESIYSAQNEMEA